MAAGANNATSRRWTGLVLEAMVVFVGVYGAFMLDGYRERRVTDQRREQILTTLAQDLDEAEIQLAAVREWFESRSGGSRLATGDRSSMS